jgi:hypothetical protein
MPHRPDVTVRTPRDAFSRPLTKPCPPHKQRPGRTRRGRHRASSRRRPDAGFAAASPGRSPEGRCPTRRVLRTLATRARPGTAAPSHAGPWLLRTAFAAFSLASGGRHAYCRYPERWPSGRRRSPAKGSNTIPPRSNFPRANNSLHLGPTATQSALCGFLAKPGGDDAQPLVPQRRPAARRPCFTSRTRERRSTRERNRGVARARPAPRPGRCATDSAQVIDELLRAIGYADVADAWNAVNREWA